MAATVVAAVVLALSVCRWPVPTTGSELNSCPDVCQRMTTNALNYRYCAWYCLQDNPLVVKNSKYESHSNPYQNLNPWMSQDTYYPNTMDMDLPDADNSMDYQPSSRGDYYDALSDGRIPIFARNSGESGQRMSFVRIGRTGSNRGSSFIRIGRSSPKNAKKRPVSFVRIGRRPFYPERIGAGTFLRIRKSIEDQRDDADAARERGTKRASSFIRIGKSPPDEDENSSSPFDIVGKEEDRRASSFIRIGKSPLDEEEKRASSFIRIGKSPLDEEEKRASSFIRIGKSSIDKEKRPSSFVRIGKSQEPNFHEARIGNSGHEEKLKSFFKHYRFIPCRSTAQSRLSDPREDPESDESAEVDEGEINFPLKSPTWHRTVRIPTNRYGSSYSDGYFNRHGRSQPKRTHSSIYGWKGRERRLQNPLRNGWISSAKHSPVSS